MRSLSLVEACDSIPILYFRSQGRFMSLFNQALASIARFLHQAWHTIPLWEKPNGDGINAQADASGNLFVSVGGSGGGTVNVEGVVDDDSPVGTTKPVVVGGVYYADPTADTLDDADAGYALLNNQRMQVVEDRVYDAPSDANRNIPVWSVPDGWAPVDLSSSLGADGTVTKYLVMLPANRVSLQFIPTKAAAETIALTLAVSNEDTGDVTTQTYTDVTTDLTGAASITAESVIEPELPISTITLRVQVTVSGWTAGTSAWDLFAVKGNNS